MSSLSRRLSIDQLTEEAEADLANNNDPNNNASSGNEGQDYPPHVPQGPVHEDLGGGEHTSFRFDEPSQAAFVKKYFLEEEDDDVDDDPFQRALERDINLILKVMPGRSYDEVRYMLESHQENPSRVQVSKIFLTYFSLC